MFSSSNISLCVDVACDNLLGYFSSLCSLLEASPQSEGGVLRDDELELRKEFARLDDDVEDGMIFL